MSLRRIIRDECGFTLQELMVVVLIGSILIAFAFELLLFANRMFADWRHHQELRTLTGSVLERVATDIREAKRVAELSDTSLTIIRHDGKLIDYRMGSGKIRRGGASLVEEGIQAALSVKREPPKGRPQVYDIALELSDGRYSSAAKTTSSFDLTAREIFSQGSSVGGMQ